MTESNNIFERTANKLIADENAAFNGNPFSTRFFKLGQSADTKVIGRQFPQTKDIDLNIAHSLSFHELSTKEINFGRIELHKSAKLTDNISTAAISAHAFVLSKKALDIFRQFSLGNHKIYPATVVYKDKSYEYGVLHFINDYQDFLDFEKSQFYVANILLGYEFDIDISSKEDFEKKKQQVKTGQYPGTENWWYIRLKLGVFKDNTNFTDIFNISSSSAGAYISKDLHTALIENTIMGFQLDKVSDIAD